MNPWTSPYVMIHLELTGFSALMAAIILAAIVTIIFTGGWCSHRLASKRKARRNKVI